MRPILTLAAKDFRLMLRDPRAGVILLLMPVLLVFILGLTVGGAFDPNKKEQLRISVVNLDAGLLPDAGPFPGRPWSDILLEDFASTADIKVELIPSREQAEALVHSGERAVVIILEPEFSDHMQRCSFVGEPLKKNPINPLYRDGIQISKLGVTVVRDPTQEVAAAVVEQVVQVALMRVVIPWMIGQAFEMIGTPPFMDKMKKYVPSLHLLPGDLLKSIGDAMQKGISGFFVDYDFRGKTWAKLTKSEPPPTKAANTSAYQSDGSGAIRRGAVRYQALVPSYTVTFAFFLVLVMGWLFAAERRHGTIVRLNAAPIARWQLLLGKLLPCFAVSLLQGFGLLIAGWVIFGMPLGSRPELLIPVVFCTSLAAVGLAMLVAAVAKTEQQVSVNGTLLVMVLAGLSGSLMPRYLMPEEMRRITRVTPHAWSLDAYSQLLTNPEPQTMIVWTACAALCGFGLVFLLIAWWRMSVEK
ncbi:ABC transporter permease [Limnoglobus roseus]|uniref:ABC transporter permease n=1 Tax=Limnoglobus roseus TaxID=2598579 RepID=A0A5C1ARG7_9BACT|nr:ABC transporter permease [Limnoglobus roseus]QEL19794.1 ABC transporter permease [Limnoglobus roseus]